VSKSNWIPTDKVIDPDLLRCISNFTSEIKSLTILKENNNIDQSKSLALRDIRRNKSLVFKKADKGSATVIMDKKYYFDEGYRQLNNNHHYRKIKTPLFPQTSVKVSEILNRLRNSGVITGKQLQFLLPPINPRPWRFYMFPKIHKAFNSWTFPDKMPHGRPIVSDCKADPKMLQVSSTVFLKHLQ